MFPGQRRRAIIGAMPERHAPILYEQPTRFYASIAA